MHQGKVAVIGAGSAFFGPQVVVGLVGRDDLEGLHMALHDVDAGAVERMGRFADRLVSERRSDRTVSAGTDLAASLDGADCVIVSVAVDRERTWARDQAIAREHCIEHYAENGGPAALPHTGRNLALILPIAREMERRCPDAWLLNYTNPVPRIATALDRFTSIRAVGVCHQLDFGYFMVGCLLGDVLGIDAPAECRFRWTDESVTRQHELALATKRRVRIVAAGLNHFTWMLSVRRREDGSDLYPLLRERVRCFDPGFEPLSRKVFELFDSFPVGGDCHLAEYLPFTHNPARGTWHRYDIQGYDLAWSERQRAGNVALVESFLRGECPAAELPFGSERAEELVAALLGRATHEDEALNVRNDGAIANLPGQAIVEVPVTLDASGTRAVACGPLPEPIAELCRRQVTINELCVAGLCEGDRHKLVQAIALDPMIDDPALPERLVDAYLESSASYLESLS